MRSFLAFSLAFLLAACGKSDDASSESTDEDGGKPSAGTPAGGQPWEDQTKPYLDDRNLGNFIASLKDRNGPFQEISKGKVTPFNADAKWKDFDASARKHGFQSGEEYLGAWLRIGAVNTAVMQEETNRTLIQAQEEGIRNQEEMLQKPDVTPDMRKMIEEHLKNSRESLEQLKKTKVEGIHEQDIAVFKKHRAEFEEAMKNWGR